MRELILKLFLTICAGISSLFSALYFENEVSIVVALPIITITTIWGLFAIYEITNKEATK